MNSFKVPAHLTAHLSLSWFLFLQPFYPADIHHVPEVSASRFSHRLPWNLLKKQNTGPFQQGLALSLPSVKVVRRRWYGEEGGRSCDPADPLRLMSVNAAVRLHARSFGRQHSGRAWITRRALHSHINYPLCITFPQPGRMTASLIIARSAKEIVSGEAPPTEVMSNYFVSAEYLFFPCLPSHWSWFICLLLRSNLKFAAFVIPSPTDAQAIRRPSAGSVLRDDQTALVIPAQISLCKKIRLT